MVVLLLLLLASSSPLASSTRSPSPSTAAVAVKWWDIDAAVSDQKITYEEQALAFTLQGLANKRSDGKPTLMFKAGFLDFDWPDADSWWRRELEVAGRVTYTNLTSTLCGLVESFTADEVTVAGAVLYDNAQSSGSGYTLPMALTLSGQESLLPVTEALLANHSCLAKLKVVHDLRIGKNGAMASRDAAWKWAIVNLLPKASTSTVFNLYHFDPAAGSDPQSHATLANLDYAIMSKAFIMDLRPNDPADNKLMAEIFSKLDPLFDAFGWARDEHAWTQAVSVGGGTVFCSFASPNLSFWALLPLPAAAGGKARRLPSGDSGAPLNKSKYYLTFETNEGDTPRIIDSAFGSSWASPLRGSVPVAWSVDPVNSERFPALMDYFASTAKPTDSFIGGVAGAGYVYLGSLSEEQLQRYTARVGKLYKEYGPEVADTYGQANLTTIAKYSKYAAQGGGMAPTAYVSQPLWSHGRYAQGAYKCPELNLYSPTDGTPIICTPNTPSLFYRNRGFDNRSSPAAQLAARIRTAAARYSPPYFITIYGGLSWEPGTAKGPTEFWTMLNGIMKELGDGYAAVGASEMARLAREACNRTGLPPTPAPTPPSCSVTVLQHDCSPYPGHPWKNSTQDVCDSLGCCWHAHGVRPSGHTCIKKEEKAQREVPTCLSPRM